ncbi:MAG: hypothetical protein Q4C83_01250 [Candidatus Saccharibacteria bacterium]|nr:hypothetical protein [Candidatus Saccharibacteria bacterium]
MNKNGRFGIILLVIIVALVMIGGIVFLGQTLFTSGGGEKVAQTSQAKLLTEPSDNTAIQMTVRGPIVAKEQHYDITLKVTANSRNLVVYQGYDRQTEIKRLDLDNSDSAFRKLLLALNQAGFTHKQAKAQTKDDGLCANGQLIEYSLSQGNDVKMNSWITTCQGMGDFTGDSAQVNKLLLEQIPDANKIISRAKESLQK